MVDKSIGNKGFIFLVGIILLLSLVVAGSGCTDKTQSDLRSCWSVIRPPSDVESIALSDNIIWAGGKEGVFGIDPNSGEIVTTTPCGQKLPYVQALLLDTTGRLWVGYNGGVVEFDGSDCVFYTTEQGLTDNRVNALIQDSEDRIIAGTWGGISIYEDGKWQKSGYSDGLIHEMVNVILEDSTGGLWFGSYVAPNGGISYYKDGKWQYFTIENGLPHNNVNAIVEDSMGNVWVGTGLYDRGGAVKLVYNGSGWEIGDTFVKDDGLAGEKVRSLFEDRSGNMWLGSEYDGVAYFKDGVFTVLGENDGLSSPEVKCFAQSDDGTLWMGTRDGITRISVSGQ